MIHYPAGTRPSRTGPEAWFTGRVRIDPVMEAPAPATLTVLSVTFEPGARTHWHTHPLGQTIHVLSGLCLVQREGGELLEVRPGDTVFFEPGERHWHGASPEIGMTHLAMQEALDGRSVDWAEAVAETDYSAPPLRAG